jgi:hypothetical protein
MLCAMILLYEGYFFFVSICFRYYLFLGWHLKVLPLLSNTNLTADAKTCHHCPDNYSVDIFFYFSNGYEKYRILNFEVVTVLGMLNVIGCELHTRRDLDLRDHVLLKLSF